MIIVQDDAFEDHNKFRMDALDRYKNNLFEQGGNYPGKRFFISDDFLIKTITTKVRSLTNSKVSCGNISYNFISKDYCQGFPHDDRGRKYTCILYLNPNPPNNTGTELYNLYTQGLCKEPYVNQKKNVVIKETFFERKYKNVLDRIFYSNHVKKLLNDLGSKTVIANKYNRLLVFDSNLIHRAQNYFGDGIDSRLCLIAFFN